ncbi:hypothetical protein CHUAL_012189 [Chamberlinius hualienensis]
MFGAMSSSLKDHVPILDEVIDQIGVMDLAECPDELSWRIKILTFRLEIAGCEEYENIKTIWRTIMLQSDQSFYHLHCIIQNVFDWSDKGDHIFEVYKNGKTEYIGQPDVNATEMPLLSGFTTRLHEYFRNFTDKSLYCYGEGDRWRVNITVISVNPKTGQVVPACLDGKMASPNQNIPGPGAYSSFLKIAGNPRHPLHSEMGKYCPSRNMATFSSSEFNKRAIVFCDADQKWRERKLFSKQLRQTDLTDEERFRAQVRPPPKKATIHFADTQPMPLNVFAISHQRAESRLDSDSEDEVTSSLEPHPSYKHKSETVKREPISI